MRLFNKIPDKRSFQNPVISIGNFDGVHIGHHRILSTLLNTARKKSGEAVVITFTSHSRKILSPETPPKILTTTSEKIRAISGLGIKNIILLDFTPEMSRMHASDFFYLLLRKIGVIDIVVGYDHAFGRNREGNFKFLKELSRVRGFGVTRVVPKNIDSQPISSTRIRTELEDGNMAIANRLLGRNYTLSGAVTKGIGRGRIIGFPTANILPEDPDKVIPGDGVYAVIVSIQGRFKGSGMLNIGNNPTFRNKERTIEVNIFNFNEDIYGSELELEFCSRVRAERRFDSVEELANQLKKDRQEAIRLLATDLHG